MDTPPTARLLIVDDEAAQVTALCRTLQMEGYSATGFVSASEALAALRDGAFDILITDLMMPEMDGLAVPASDYRSCSESSSATVVESGRKRR